MPTVEIFDKHQGSLSFDLIDILKVLEPECRELDWYCTDFLAWVFRSDMGSNEWAFKLVDEINNSDHGVKLDWPKLLDFLSHVRQTESAVLIAVAPGAAPPPPSNTRIDPNSDQFDVVIEMFDTSLGAVTTANKTLINLVLNHFKDTTLTQRNALLGDFDPPDTTPSV